MSDFTIEQLKTVLDNMVDSLDETAGDKGTHAELQQIKHLIQDIKAQIIKDARDDAKQNQALIKNFFDEWDRNNPLRDLRKSVDDLAKKSDNPLRQAGGAGGGNNNNKPADDNSNPFKNKATEMAMGKLGGKLRGLTTALELAGGAALGAYGWLKGQAESYRTFLSTAEGSVSTMMEMRDTAAKNGMTVETLNNAMKLENLRAQGAKNFAKLDNQVRKTTRDIGLMGMNEQQRQAALNEFMGTLRDSGMWKTQSTEEQAGSFRRLIELNQKMASIAGATRQEQLEKMRQQGTDANFETWLRTNVKNPDDMLAIKQFLNNRTPEEAKAIKEAVVLNGALLEDGASLVAMTGEHGMNMLDAAAQIRDGNFTMADAIKNQDSLRGSALALDKNKAMSTIAPILGMTGNEAASARNSLIQNAGRQKDSGEVKDVFAKENNDDFQNAVMGAQDMEDRIAASLTDMFNEGFLKYFGKDFGPTLLGIQNKLLALAEKGHDVATWLGENPVEGRMVGYGGAIAALAGGTALSMAGMKGAKGMFNRVTGRGGARAPAAGAGAAAGAAGGGSRWMNMLKGGKAAMKGNLLVGGLLESTDYIWGDKALSGKNLLKSGLALGGGALGGLLGGTVGSAAGPVGTAAGGIAGGMYGYSKGQQFANWLLGEDDSKAAMAAGAQPGVKPIAGVQPNKAPPANATGQKNGGTIADIVALDKQMVEMQHRIHYTLLDIKKASYDQLNTMREELAVHRANADRIARLLEESNKNTKQIGALT